jgi:DNA-binding NarL/FixJ family response regulator
MAKPRTLAANDTVLDRELFDALAPPHADAVTSTADGRELLTAVREAHPEVVILEASSPFGSSLDAVRQINQFDPSITVVVVSLREDDRAAAETFRRRGSAHLLERSTSGELVAAIRHAMTRPMTDEASGSRLTSRQRDVLRLLADGKSMKEIGRILNVAPRTVAFHKYRMMEQLKIETSAGLIRFAVHQHLV